MAKKYIHKRFFFYNACTILCDKLLASVLYIFYYVSRGPGESKRLVGREDCTMREQGGQPIPIQNIQHRFLTIWLVICTLTSIQIKKCFHEANLFFSC
jgi:hypothetical protein